METQTIWGTVAEDGSIISGTGFSIMRQNEGNYLITFSLPFSGTPAIVGSQTGMGFGGQVPLDGIVFPFLDSQSATAFTADQHGVLKDRQFSFIVMGAVQG